MNSGETWAYRRRGKEPLEPVQIVRRGTTRPKWLFVTFEAPEAEGRQEWVPEGRLKASWDERQEFMAREDRWDAVTRESGDVTKAQEWASWTVFDVFDSEQRVEYSVQGRAGVCKISQPHEFTQKHGLDYSVLLVEPTAFEEDAAVVIPWAGTELLARTLVGMQPVKVLEAVQQAEAAAMERLAVDVQRLVTSWNKTPYRNDQALETARAEQESRDIVRQWCGQPALDQWYELQTLRREVARLGSIIAKAASVLEAKGHKRDATEIRKLHGLPTEVQNVDMSYQALKKHWETAEKPV